MASEYVIQQDAPFLKKKEIALTLQKKRGFALGNKPLLLHVILY